MLKNLLGNGKTAVENFRQVLKTLRDDFLSDVIITVEVNVIRILAEVEFISKDVKEMKEKVENIGEDVKGVG